MQQNIVGVRQTVGSHQLVLTKTLNATPYAKWGAISVDRASAFAARASCKFSVWALLNRSLEWLLIALGKGPVRRASRRGRCHSGLHNLQRWWERGWSRSPEGCYWPGDELKSAISSYHLSVLWSWRAWRLTPWSRHDESTGHQSIRATIELSNVRLIADSTNFGFWHRAADSSCIGPSK